MLDRSFVQSVYETTCLVIDQSDHVRGLYATDASLYQVSPVGVVIPESLDQVPTLLQLCSEYGVALLPRGGGTSLAGQCVNEALVIDFSTHCHQLSSYSKEGRCSVVECGMTIEDLNDQIRGDGLFFAPDPSTARQANIGGCIGNNAAGVHSVLYGRTSDQVLGIEVALADGQVVFLNAGAAKRDPLARELTRRIVDVVDRYQNQIRERFPKTMRRSSGYQLDVILEQLETHQWNIDHVNLAPLLCGSEGTLACTLRAELQLHRIPDFKALVVLSFDSLDRAIEMVLPILETYPAGVELLDDLIIDLARENTECREYVDRLPDPAAKAVLFVEYFASSSDALDKQLARLQECVGSAPLHILDSSEGMADAWALRKAGEPLLHGISGNRKPLGFIEDNAVPVENLVEFVYRLKQIIEREGTVASYYAHASVGVLHVRPLLDLRDPEDEQAMHRIAQQAADLAKELGGVPSGEHGDGRVRGPFIEEYFGSELLDAFREVKSIFDPKGIMNPGNIVDPKPVHTMSENTRIKPHGQIISIPQLPTHYQFQQEHGFAHASELCNGAGVCRRKSGGVMCPSYQATLEERHSTRGRGNALRLAITGQTQLGAVSGSPDWNDPDTQDTLDLCLSCKGCKSQCPSSVDISKLKSEYLAQGYKEQGRVPFSVQVMSRIHLLNQLGGRMPRLSNFLQQQPIIRSVINHSLTIHPERSLPKFASRVLKKKFTNNGSPKIILFSDTFTTHNDPGIAHATVRVYEAFGYDVAVEPVSDFGRSAISLGHLPKAIQDAQAFLDRQSFHIQKQDIQAFLIPEPSCLSAVCDDWLDLNLDRDPELVQLLSQKASLPETFLFSCWNIHPTIPEFRSPSGQVIVHGHCHQKSLWGDSTTSAIFEKLFPGVVEVLKTGCCGMAGSFGYKDHRFNLSMNIGEQSLFPAVRELNDHDVLIAPGTSCRHQIADGVQIKAIHPIELLANLLVSEDH